MIYPHYSKAPWNSDRWPNFSPKEFACKHCGETYHDERVFDAIQAARTTLNRPIRINSAHRCRRHNARVGGAPRSQHLKMALDVSLRGHDWKKLKAALLKAGFSTFGYYNSFIHVDMRVKPNGKGRFWFGGKSSRRAWSKI